MNSHVRIGIVGAVLALGVGYFLGAKNRGGTEMHAGHGVEMWTCSMHPQIKREAPGLCPICEMDLVPLKGDASGAVDAAGYRLSPQAARLAEVRVMPVRRQYLTREVALVGTVSLDETRVKTISARVPGRIDRLFVDYTGIPVKSGDHLVELYSPELISAQEELLQGLRTVKALGPAAGAAGRERAEALVDTGRRKLELLGLSAGQVAAIERKGAPTDHLTIHSPLAGVVVRKHVTEGSYVKTGTAIFTVADLGHVWVTLDAYETDLPWIRIGQPVSFGIEAIPGRTFEGRVSFIDPQLDQAKRTVRVRVNVANPDGVLKPGLFVRATLKARTAGHGQVLDDALLGKWISPMHPEIVKDGPGDCDMCGMKLVKAEELGYASAGNREAPLVIPDSAPLLTGKRAVVYVASKEEPGLYEGRDVTLGPRAGGYYVIEDGLNPGELVVVNGAFKIDSAIQIETGAGMMSHESEPDAHAGHDHAKSREALSPLLSASYVIQKALAADDFAAAKRGVVGFEQAVATADADTHAEFAKAIEQLNTAGDIAALRKGFKTLSDVLIPAAAHVGSDTVMVTCPMAFDDTGASWLQADKAVRNPYFGDEMLECGAIRPLTGLRHD